MAITMTRKSKMESLPSLTIFLYSYRFKFVQDYNKMVTKHKMTMTTMFLRKQWKKEKEELETKSRRREARR